MLVSCMLLLLLDNMFVLTGPKVSILKRHNPRFKSSVVALSSSLQANPMLLSNSGSQGFLSSTGARCKALSALSSPFLGEDDDDLWRKMNVLPIRSRYPSLPRAYKDDISKIRYPVKTKKPEWWLKTLACVPYLIALQISGAGYFVHPFLEHYEMFENLIYFVPGAINRLPPWFSRIYCSFGYAGIVKNKALSRYIRIHLMMGMLLETAFKLIWYTGNFLLLTHFNGNFMMHFWAGIGIGYIFVLLECVRCALGGKYAHIPVISNAAYIHTRFNVGGFQRPF
ncbi:protein TIC 20-IV, chloroplastic-like isoform X1 [Gossypium australe]|uniref:Protein TIC 20 n=1 Tax=Gossypium australe TaxID=47621 RepID=A0A5B6V3D8_9ROSI|nr:protein TIC 20-IV, chloroplastic-like isoform X1 [Gossypium australe]